MCYRRSCHVFFTISVLKDDWFIIELLQGKDTYIDAPAMR